MSKQAMGRLGIKKAGKKDSNDAGSMRHRIHANLQMLYRETNEMPEARMLARAHSLCRLLKDHGLSAESLEIRGLGVSNIKAVMDYSHFPTEQHAAVFALAILCEVHQKALRLYTTRLDVFEALLQRSRVLSSPTSNFQDVFRDILKLQQSTKRH